MWADNETRVDLLGFDFLVDELLVVLRDPRLLPITVGVAGDWGSGKSSLLGMTEEALTDEKVLTVSFSPWRFEDYEDVKTALMAAVIGALQERARTDQSFASKAGKRLARLVGRVNFLGAARVAGQAALAAHGAHVPPEVTALAGTPLLKQEVEDADTEEPDADRLRSIGDFRAEFSELMEGLDDSLTMLVVFIDDLDRCLTDTVVDTFEAIRLFLHVPKTAYVIAADQRVVQAAIESRYPAAREGDESLGVDYLEKIIQLSINVPPLSEPEAETYINLLFAELSLEPEAFGRILAAAQTKRRAEQLTVAMNYGIAKEVLGSVPAELEASFALANQITPVLARGLRGNPRQLKRFLNILTVRRRAASARSIELDAAVLAKLMILEQLHLKDFERLFRWQIDQQGRPLELKQAEMLTSSGKKPKEMADDSASWARQGHIAAWLALEPPLADVDLAPYFYFSRDRLSPAAPAARLPSALQELLGRLNHAVTATRRTAVTEAGALEESERAQLYDALVERAVRDPRGREMDSAFELAVQKSELAGRLAAALAALPPTSVPIQLPAKIVAAFSPLPAELRQLLERWRSEGSGTLKARAGEALEGAT
jgi:predicted KAP-like P-loop ATPase